MFLNNASEKYFSLYINLPQANFLNVKLPDDKIKWNEERCHYDFGDIDWNEFWKVVKGSGPCK